MAFDEYKLQRRAMTSDEVLHFFVEIHKVLAYYHEADERLEIHPDTILQHWRDSDFGDPWFSECKVETWLQRAFGFSASDEEWASATRPWRKRTLGPLCDFIATRASVPVILSVNLLGQSCESAGVFLAVRKLLEEKGIATENLKPSSPLRTIEIHGLPEIHMELWRMRPNLVARINEHYPSDAGFMLAGILLLLGAAVLLLLGIAKHWLFMPGAVISLVLFFRVWKRSLERRERPSSVSVEGCETFADLCRLMIDEKAPA